MVIITYIQEQNTAKHATAQLPRPNPVKFESIYSTRKYILLTIINIMMIGSKFYHVLIKR